MNRREYGDMGERIAERYLVQKGFTIVGRNVIAKGGELDIVAVKDQLVVIAEVKTRRSGAVRPAQAVTPAKIRSISKAALWYLSRQGWLDREIRFDVLEIIGAQDSLEIEHLCAAFDFDPSVMNR